MVTRSATTNTKDIDALAASEGASVGVSVTMAVGAVVGDSITSWGLIT